jgi:hypothetical protein
VQDSSAEFETAVAAHRTWVPPRLRADWSGGGYRGDGTIDDLSGQMGEEWEVDHTLDDGYPDTVTFVSGTSVPEFTTSLVGRSGSSPVPLTTTAAWTGSSANDTSTYTTASLTVPAGTLRPGDWLLFSLAINNTTATIATTSDGIDLLAGPTLDGSVVQTVIYGGIIDQDLADDGGTFTWHWSTASQFTLIGASIGMRDGTSRSIPLELVGASQTNESGSSVTSHTTPTVVTAATYNVVASLWNRATTTAMTWTMAAGDTEAIETVGTSGASSNVDASIGYGAVQAAGSYSRTATTTASSNATMAIVVLAAADAWESMTSAAYWSPLRTDSPVYGKDRDIPPLSFDVGLVTEAGREHTRIFTGQMVNTSVRGGQAQLQSISATRLKLMKLVQPPAFAATYSAGLRVTWPVSFNLMQCGLYAGPQIRPGTAWYAPMHGSAWAMIPSGNTVYTAEEAALGSSFPHWNTYEQRPADVSPVLTDGAIDWIRGPYVSAPDLQLTTDLRRAMYTSEMRFDQDANDAFSQAGNAGRLEMWVRGDATNVNTAPGGSATVTRLCSLWAEADITGAPYFRLGITPTRHVEVEVYDTGTVWRLTSTGTLPTSGAWVFVGAGYDMTADRLWVNLDGTVQSSTAGMVTSTLPAVDAYTSTDPVFLSVLPVAEVTFTTGAQANADLYPLWRSDASFAPTATLEPSINRLVALVEAEPREAWQTITDYAMAELASVRLTETDEFQFLPLSWWVQDDQQVIVDAFDTARNAAAFDVDLDPTKIRNSIKVTYTDTKVVDYSAAFGGYQMIYERTEDDPIPIPAGVTVLKALYSSPGILPLQKVTLWDNTPISGTNLTQVSLCDIDDGTGTYAVTGQVVVTFDAWDTTSATLRFTNNTQTTWYLTNDADFGSVIIVGLPVIETSTYAIDLDETSVADRGERALDVSAQGLQTSVAARRLARNLKMALRRAVATIGADQQGVEVLGDPRRQPGDLATFRDSVTGVEDGRWRLRGVLHRGSGASYQQQVVARRTKDILIIGEGLIGDTLIGPGE